jgi:short-subunit dehydrogenase
VSTVILGASTGLGRALARQWAQAGETVWLLARSREEMEREAASLKLTRGADVRVLVVDASDAPALEAAIRTVVLKEGHVHTLLCPIGASREDDDTLLPAGAAANLLHVNMLATITAVSSCLPVMMEKGEGHIVGVGSIAAFRGRGRNAVYSAAKRGLESYFESLRHKTAGSGVRTHLFRVGYIDSQQSYGQRLQFPALDPGDLAAKIRLGIMRSDGTRTVPRYFRLIGAMLQLIPWTFYRRMNF